MPLALFRAVWRAAVFVALTLVLLPFAVLLHPLGSAPRTIIRRLWCRGVCLILGLRTRRLGEPFHACPTLFVANHVSYLDICLIGGFIDATFIAKSEVAAWPLFGLLARLGQTMFIRRHWRQALIQRDMLAERMRWGESFVLFAEGTSTDGLDLAPLKTSLLSVAEPWILDRPIAVQPLTLTYLRLADGSLIDASNADRYAWWGDTEMLPHLLRLLCLPGAEIVVQLGAPVLSWEVSSRKALGRALHAEIRSTLQDARGAAVNDVVLVPAPLVS